MATEPEPARTSQKTSPGFRSSCQRHRPHFGLRDETALGTRLRKQVVGVAESAKLRGSPRPVRSIGFALQDDDVERVEFHVADVAEFPRGDALVLAAQVLADVGGEIVDAAGEELASDAGGMRRFRREQTDGLGRSHLVEHVLERPRRQVGEVRFLPGLLDAREGQLHAADVREHLEVLGADPIAQVAGRAVEERVADRDDGDTLHPPTCAQPFDGAGEVAADSDPLRGQLGQEFQRGIRPEHHFGGRQQLTGADGESGGPVGPNAHHGDLRKRGVVHDFTRRVQTTCTL